MADFPLAALEDVRLGDDLRPGASWLPQLARAWENEIGIEIHWAIPWHKGKSELEIVRWNQRFHVLPCAGISLSMLLGRRPQKRLVRELFGKIEPDLIHVWGSENLAGAALECFDGPKLFSLQGILGRLRQTGELKGLRWAAFERWERESLALADCVSCESAWGCRN